MRNFTRTLISLGALAMALTSTTVWADRDRGRAVGHRRHDHDNVSINVNVGRSYYGDRSGFRNGHRDGYRDYNYRDYGYRDYRPSTVWNYGLGFGTFGSSFGSQFFINSWNAPYSRWNSYDRYYDRRPVVVEKNIYIEHSTPANRVTTRSISTSTTSLFRDRYGRCYERERDSFGNETRIELDPSQCNF